MANATDFNTKIIDEFRENEGKVGGPFAGAPMVLVHHFGAKSGQERVSPVVYQALGESFVVFASKAGSDTNPAWYHNLVAHPEVEIEVGSSTIPVRARVAEGVERERIWTKQKADMPGFADYEAKTSRQIPVVVLDRR